MLSPPPPPAEHQVLWRSWLSKGSPNFAPAKPPARNVAFLQALVSTSIEVGSLKMDVQQAVWRSLSSPKLDDQLAKSGLPGHVSLIVAQERSEPDAHRNEPVMAYLVELEKVLVPALLQANSRSSMAPIEAIFDALLEAAQRAVERAFFKDDEPAPPDSMAKIARYLLVGAQAMLRSGEVSREFAGRITADREARNVSEEWPLEAALLLAGPKGDIGEPLAREIVLMEKCFGLLRFRPGDASSAAVVNVYAKLARALMEDEDDAESDARWCAVAMDALVNGAEQSLDWSADKGALCRRITSFGYSASSYLSSLDTSGGADPALLFDRASAREPTSETKIFYSLLADAAKPQLDSAGKILGTAIALDRSLVGDSKRAKAALSVALCSMARAARFHAWIEHDESGTARRLIEQTHVLRQNVTIEATLQAFYPPMFYSEKYRKDVKSRLSFDPKSIEDEAISRIVVFTERRLAAAETLRELPKVAELRFRVPRVVATASISKKDQAPESVTATPKASKPPPPAAAAEPMKPPKAKPKRTAKPASGPAPEPAASPPPPPAPAPSPPKPAPASLDDAVRLLTMSRAEGEAFIDGEKGLLRVSDLSFMRGFDVRGTDLPIDAMASAGLVNFCLKYVAGLATYPKARAFLSWATVDQDRRIRRSWQEKDLDYVAPGSLADTEFSGDYAAAASASGRAATVIAIAHPNDLAWSFALVIGTRAAWHFALHTETDPATTEKALRDIVFAVTSKELAVSADVRVGEKLPQAALYAPADSAFVLAVLANRIATQSELKPSYLERVRYDDLASVLAAQIVAMHDSLNEAARFGRAAAMSHVFRLGYVPQQALAWLDAERLTRRLLEAPAARPQA